MSEIKTGVWFTIGFAIVAIIMLVVALGQAGQRAALQTQLAQQQAKQAEVQASVDAATSNLNALNQQVSQVTQDGMVKDSKIADLEKQLADQKAAADKALADAQKTKTDTVVPSTQLLGYTLEKALDENFETTIKQNRLSALFKGSIDALDKTIDAYDQIVLTSAFKPLVSLTSDKDFADTIYVGGTQKASVAYEYVFQDSFDPSLVSSDNPLSIQFLGQDIDIIGIPNAQEVIIATSKEYIFDVGVPQTIEGSNVQVLNVGDSSAVVSVDGNSQIVMVGKTKSFGSVRVQVSDVFTSSDKADRSAVLKIGKQITQTVADGDAAELFGESKDNPTWVWSIDMPNKIGVALDSRMDSTDADVLPLKEGDCLALPNKYAQVCFASLTKVTNSELRVTLDKVDVSNTDTPVTVLALSSSKDIFSFTAKDTNRVWIATDGAAYYKDSGKYVQGKAPGSSPLAYTFEDTTGSIALVGPTLNFGNHMSFIYDAGFTDLQDITYYSNSIKSYDNKVVDLYGYKLSDPKSSVEDDEFTLVIPSEQVKATVSVQ